MAKKPKHGERGSGRHDSKGEPRSQVASDENSTHEDAREEAAPDRATKASDGEGEDHAGAPPTPSAATQKAPATGTESFAEDLDMEKISPSIREDYFTVEHKDAERVGDEELFPDEKGESGLSPENDDDQDTDSDREGDRPDEQGTDHKEDAPVSIPTPDEEDQGGTPVETEESGEENRPKGDISEYSAPDHDLPEHKKHVYNLNEIITETLETGGWKVGRYGADEVCKGDPQMLSSKDPTKKDSLRKVFDDPELLIDSRRAGQLVGAEFFRRDLVRHKKSTPNLLISHIIAMLPLKDQKLRLELAEEANNNKYSVRKIAERVKELNREGLPEDKGKKILRMLEGSLRPLEDEDLLKVCSDKEALLRELSSADRQRIRRRIEKGKSKFESLDKLVGDLDGKLAEIEQESQPEHTTSEDDDTVSGQ